VDLLLVEVDNFRQALARNDTTAAMSHAIAAVHHHAAAYMAMAEWKERAEEAAEKGSKLTYANISNDTVVALFKEQRSKGNGRDAACNAVAAELSLGSKAIRTRLKKLDAWR
jgi:hypothetical protein